jgi:polyhydroxyalkanoate synthesis repressor PhaR
MATAKERSSTTHAKPRATAKQAKAGGGQTAREQPALRIIKKYPNRRLYDIQSSSYITLADVKAIVMRGEAFEVRDAKDSHDLTRSILLQIILEEESGGVPMFSSAALEQIIRFYGHAMQGMAGAMLEQNLRTMVDMQQRFTEQAKVLTPQAWAQFVGKSMNGMADPSKNLFAQMQDQFAQSAGALFSGFVPPKR